MKKRIIILAALLFVVLGAGSVYIARGSIWPNKAVATTKQTKPADPTVISYTAKSGISSLAQLKQEAKGVVTVQSSYGEYVDTIGSHKGGTDGKYWSFYIDGKLSDVGAGTYIQKGGEKIVWKFQKL